MLVKSNGTKSPSLKCRYAIRREILATFIDLQCPTALFCATHHRVTYTEFIGYTNRIFRGRESITKDGGEVMCPRQDDA